MLILYMYFCMIYNVFYIRILRTIDRFRDVKLKCKKMSVLKMTDQLEYTLSHKVNQKKRCVCV